MAAPRAGESGQLVAERLAELETRLGGLTELRGELRVLLRDWDHRLSRIPARAHRPVFSTCSLTDPSSIASSRASVGRLALRIRVDGPWSGIEFAPQPQTGSP